MTVLIDTSVLLAVSLRRDIRHSEATQVIQRLGREPKIVLDPIMMELFQIVASRAYYERAIDVLVKVRSLFQVETLTHEDRNRMIEIMRRYRTNQFDFADVAIMAVAERLNIQRICTFDRRDFGIYRPRHCAYFELLP
jgi:hypothetical protein